MIEKSKMTMVTPPNFDMKGMTIEFSDGSVATVDDGNGTGTEYEVTFLPWWRQWRQWLPRSAVWRGFWYGVFHPFWWVKSLVRK